MKKETILVIGSCGQLGTELVEALREIYGIDQVIASDIRKAAGEVFESGPFELLDILDAQAWKGILQKYQPTQVYHLAALLSATAEQQPEFAWKLNMQGLFHVLDAAKEPGSSIGRVYWPSSIAAFGPNTPRFETPQYGPMDPTTVYGISKYAGELYIQYYYKRYGVDTRSLRYPGLIGHKSDPGGGNNRLCCGYLSRCIKRQATYVFPKRRNHLAHVVHARCVESHFGCNAYTRGEYQNAHEL